jgi:ribosomal protein S18 acetylase RimI-like enzyme
MMHIALSPLEEARFGVRTARVDGLTREEIPDALQFCRDNQVRMLIARIAASDLPTAQALERAGGEIMDTSVTYAIDLQQATIPPVPEPLAVRSVEPGDETAVSRLAAAAFHAYGGHYHADARLDPAKCDEVYESWAYRSCVSREVANDVLLALRGDEVVGFVTLRLNRPQEGQVPLYAVAPALQGQGIGRVLISSAMRWFTERGASRMVISTQMTNLASQKVWMRLGFEPCDVQLTFHKWFD